MNIRLIVIACLLYVVNCKSLDAQKNKTGLKGIKAGKTFLLGTDKVNFFQAYFNCKDAEMELASINSKDDEEEISYFLNNQAEADGGFWLSGTNLADINTEKFSWLTGGKRAIYTNWLAGEPNNDGGLENCVQWIKRSGIGGWNDHPCQLLAKYVCQDSA